MRTDLATCRAREPMDWIDHARRAALATLVYALAALATLSLERASGGVASIWVANALVLGAALRRPRAAWSLLAAAVPGTVLASLAIGYALGPGLLSGAINAVEVGLAYAVFRHLRLRADARFTDRGMLAFFGVAVLAAPAVSSTLSASLLQAGRSAPWSDVFVSWWMADALGMFLVLPLVLTLSRETAHRLLRGPRAAEFWLLALLSVATAVVAVTSLSRSYVVLSLPLLVVALRSGLAGTALCNVLVVATVFIATALQKRGLLPAAPLTPALPIASAWLFTCMSALGPLLVAVVTTQRDNMRIEAVQLSQRLRTIADSLPAYIAELGPDLRYRFANARYLEWLGHAPDAMIGRHPAEVLGPEAAARLEPSMRRALAGEPQRFEFDLHNGQHVDVAYQPLPGGAGLVLMAHDITRRVEAERRFRHLLESAPDAMVVIEPATRAIVLVNRRAELAFGAPREVLLGASLDHFVEDAGRFTPEVLRAHLDSEAAGEPLAVTARRADGTPFPAEVVLSRLENGGAVQLAAAVRDVSARLRTERILHEERERARVTLESIGDAVITCDTAGRITSLNPLAAGLIGTPRAHAVGRAYEDVVHVEEEAREPRRGASEAPVAFTGTLRRPDGTTLPVDGSHAAIREAGGAVVGRVTVLRDVSERRAMTSRMLQLAQQDALTGLPNRMLLRDRLAQALATGGRGGAGAVLYVDLDFFKTINDSLGHHTGDLVLQEVARRLSATVRADDTVSRQGGDEFVVLLVRLSDPRDAARVAEALIRAVEAPIELDGRRLHLSASIGIALFPHDGLDEHTLTKQADIALYHAKHAGRGRYSYFTAEMSERADRRLRLEHELRAALAEGQLFLAYQPKVELPARRIVGLEALVRWRHPDGHVVPPGEFIPVAEETGLVLALDAWVLGEACRQLRAWIDAGLPVVPVSVNLSLARFEPDVLVDNIRQALAAGALPAELLEIELTESQMLGHDERATRLIGGLRALGVRLAIDDFGTGYSSLSCISRHRFDTVKIDRSFVEGLPGDASQVAVVQAILAMTRALDCRVVGEGVESEAQARALAALGCLHMQGYLFGRPVDAPAMAALLSGGHAAGDTPPA